MLYEELAPPPLLAPWVSFFWRFTVRPDQEEIVHYVPLTGGVIVTCRGVDEALILGPRTSAFSVPVRGGDRFWGVHFWPGAGGALLGSRGESLRDRQGPARYLLDPVWTQRWDSSSASEPLERLESVLEQMIACAAPLDPLVMTVVFRILHSRGEESIGDLALQAGISPRQLRRRFRVATGLSPKELSRIWRLRASASDAVLGGERWVELAAKHGYADQPHLVREFRSLLGVSPGKFSHHARRIEHRLLD